MRNYCTKWIKGTWNKCCKKHDDCYGERKNRLKCDNSFFKCVTKSHFLAFLISPFMYGAVRLFGSKYYKNQRKNMKNLKKSFTMKSAVVGTGTLVAMATNQDAIVEAVNTIGILTGYGEIVHTVTLFITGLLTLFGVGKGRLDAEVKPVLANRK